MVGTASVHCVQLQTLTRLLCCRPVPASGTLPLCPPLLHGLAVRAACRVLNRYRGIELEALLDLKMPDLVKLFPARSVEHRHTPTLHSRARNRSGGQQAAWEG